MVKRDEKQRIYCFICSEKNRVNKWREGFGERNMNGKKENEGRNKMNEGFMNGWKNIYRTEGRNGRMDGRTEG